MNDSSDRRPIPDPTLLTTEALHREIGRLQELFEARVEGLVELWKEAVAAALASQKELVELQTDANERAVAKSDASTTKQLDQISDTFKTAFDGLRRDIDSAKERISSVEGKLS